jgi:hypothetical protein
MSTSLVNRLESRLSPEQIYLLDSLFFPWGKGKPGGGSLSRRAKFVKWELARWQDESYPAELKDRNLGRLLGLNGYKSREFQTFLPGYHKPDILYRIFSP